MAEFVESFVYGPSGFTNIHEKVFTGRADAVETRFLGDFSELFFRRSEGYPRGPGKGGPGV